MFHVEFHYWSKHWSNFLSCGCFHFKDATANDASSKRYTWVDLSSECAYVEVLIVDNILSFSAEAPWYCWLGGSFGTYYIIVNIFTVPKLGAGTVLSIFVCAQVHMRQERKTSNILIHMLCTGIQVVAACIIDHFGLTGVKKRRFTLWRLLASLSLIGCVAVITLF